MILLHHLRAIAARRRLEFQADIASLFDKDGYRLRSKLAQVAFADDPRTLALVMDRVTRR